MAKYCYLILNIAHRCAFLNLDTDSLSTKLERCSMSKTVDIASKAEVSITGKKYCSSHQGYVDVQQGNIVTKTNSRRWICFSCQEKSKLLNKRA